MPEQVRPYAVVEPHVDQNGQRSYRRAPEQPDPEGLTSESDVGWDAPDTAEAPSNRYRLDDASAFEFYASAETTTLYLDSQQRLWVRLKRELDFGQQNELDNASVTGFSAQQARARAQVGQTLIHTDMGRQRLLKLALYIDDWNFPGPDGKTLKWPRHISERVGVLRRMNARLATAILQEIDRLIAEQNERLEQEGYAAGASGAPDETDPTRLAVIEGEAR